MRIEYQRNVEEFMRLSGQVVYEKPRVMTLDQARLRYDLYKEEVEEFVEAYKERNRVLMLDAIIDIMYILLGTASTAGERLSAHTIDMLIEMHTGNEENRCGIIAKRKIAQSLIARLEGASVVDFAHSIATVIKLAFIIGFTKRIIQTAFQRVHASNMTKFCPDSVTVNDTVKAYAEKGVDTYVECVGDYLVVYRHPDGKVMKSVDYEPVVLEDLVEGVAEWE